MLNLLVVLVALAVALSMSLLVRPYARAVHPRARAGAILVLGVLSALVFSDVARAQEIDASDSVGEIRLSAFTVSIILSAFIPIFTAIVTKLNTSTKVKGLVTMAGNYAATAIVTWQVADGSAVFSQETLATAVLGFVVSTATYLGFYQDVDINAKLLPDKGI